MGREKKVSERGSEWGERGRERGVREGRELGVSGERGGSEWGERRVSGEREDVHERA